MSAPAGAVDRATLEANIIAQFPDNGTGAITPAILRTFLTQLCESAFLWDGDIVPGANGGTGVANTSHTITLGGNLATTGAFSTTLAQQGTTTVQLPVGNSLTAKAGNAVLVGGTVNVANTTITANTVISLTRKVVGGSIGNLTYVLDPGVKFTINSDSGSDTSTISYVLIEVP